MSLNICVTCEKEYDADAFGAGRRYCSAQCKHTKGGEKQMKEVGGRPRRWPKLTPTEKDLVIGALQELGFLLVKPLDGNKYSRGGVAMSRGYFSARLALGGSRNCEKWADVVVYVDVHGKMIFDSACIKATGKFSGPERHDGTKPVLNRGRCMRDRCMKCTRYRWLRTLLENPKASRLVTAQ